MSCSLRSRSICADCLRLIRSNPTFATTSTSTSTSTSMRTTRLQSRLYHVDPHTRLRSSRLTESFMLASRSKRTHVPQLPQALFTTPHLQQSEQKQRRHLSTPTTTTSSSINTSHPPPAVTTSPQADSNTTNPPPTTTTTTLLNPRPHPDSTDPTQPPMHMKISPRASARLAHLMRTESNPALALRITVTSGGCHGFQYLMSLESLPESVMRLGQGPREPGILARGKGEEADPASTVDQQQQAQEDDEDEHEPFEDTIFTTAANGAKVILDEPSLELLTGSTVDYTQELIGSQFKVVGNPAASSSCGCGTSFDIKA